ncbi:SH2/SH3 adapter protein dreadlocks-like [Clytia hemisphaerica]|uniref:Uncharacterized protein n=1 Tax=Clytia hemisphaerica TaxID=252671 RepID=A0A7M6DQX1_9CNID
MSDLGSVRTLYAYTAQNDEEMSFESDLVFKILDKNDENWWLALNESTSKQGLVPTNYVEEIPSHEENEDNEVNYMNPAELFQQNDGYEKMEQPKKKVFFNVLTKFKYQATYHDELSFEANELLEIVETSNNYLGWLTAKNSKGESGIIPGNYVEEIVKTPSPTTAKMPDILQNCKDIKEHRASLLVERQDPFPVEKATEAKSSPGVKTLTKLLVDSQDAGFRREAYFAGKVGRSDCERKLKGKKEGAFLIRESESSAGNVTLSLKCPEDIIHFLVKITPDEFIIGHRSFATIQELVDYYSHTNPIYTSKSGKKVFLGTPYHEK